jgi:uncharacterized protein with ATP-grasp and redox domains
MQTSPARLPCFRSQARYVTELVGAAPELTAEIVAATEQLLAGLDLRLSPPENAVALYNLIADMSGCPDPFAVRKKESNRAALVLLPYLRQIVAESPEVITQSPDPGYTNSRGRPSSPAKSITSGISTPIHSVFLDKTTSSAH